jgi:hypothetical protein
MLKSNAPLRGALFHHPHAPNSGVAARDKGPVKGLLKGLIGVPGLMPGLIYLKMKGL